MKKIIFIFLLFAFSSGLLLAADSGKVKIRADKANIRSQPNLDAEIVLVAKKGDVFEVIEKTGTWFKIALTSKDSSKTGYVSETLVEAVGDEKEEKPAASTPKTSTVSSEKGKAKEPAAIKKFTPDPKFLSGFSAKLGLQLSPKETSFGNRLILAAGYDLGLNPYLAVGGEIQPFLRSYSATDLKISIIGFNLFANAKGGICLGMLSEPLKILKFYGGLGFGTQFSFKSVDMAGEKISHSNVYFAWHLMFGLEAALKTISLLLEYQIIKVSVPDVTNFATNVLLFGVRF